MQLDELMHSFSYLSGSQRVSEWVSEWVLHSSWLSSIRSDSLISSLSKPTPAPPVKAVSLLRSRWGPLSNKQQSWFRNRVTCKVWSQATEDIIIIVRTCGIDERCQEWLKPNMRSWRHSVESLGCDRSYNTMHCVIVTQGSCNICWM